MTTLVIKSKWSETIRFKLLERLIMAFSAFKHSPSALSLWLFGGFRCPPTCDPLSRPRCCPTLWIWLSYQTSPEPNGWFYHSAQGAAVCQASIYLQRTALPPPASHSDASSQVQRPRRCDALNSLSLHDIQEKLAGRRCSPQRSRLKSSLS